MRMIFLLDLNSMQKQVFCHKTIACGFVVFSTFACGKETSSGSTARAAVSQPTRKPRSGEKLPEKRKTNDANGQPLEGDRLVHGADLESEDGDQGEGGNPGQGSEKKLFTEDQATRSENGYFYARIKQWSSGPVVTTDDASRNAFVIEIGTKKLEKPLDLADYFVRPCMKIHGHGVPRAYLPSVSSSEPYLIEVTNLGFVMSGPWEIILEAKVNGLLDTVEIPVEVP